MTLREGKNEGTYFGSDFDMEYEYGGIAFRRAFHLSNIISTITASTVTATRWMISTPTASAALELRVLSPFKDPVGLALRLEGGYLLHDEVDGLDQHERFIKPEIDLQKDFFNDRLIYAFNFGTEWAWG